MSGRRASHRLSLLAIVVLQVLALMSWPGGAQPALASDLFSELRNFPGVVLVPATALEPFSLLEPWRVELNRPRAGSVSTGRGR
jgi:hypothetical protein